MSKLYKLVTVQSGKKVTLPFYNWQVANKKLLSLGSGKLYLGAKLVGEL